MGEGNRLETRVVGEEGRPEHRFVRAFQQEAGQRGPACQAHAEIVGSHAAQRKLSENKSECGAVQSREPAVEDKVWLEQQHARGDRHSRSEHRYDEARAVLLFCPGTEDEPEGDIPNEVVSGIVGKVACEEPPQFFGHQSPIELKVF